MDVVLHPRVDHWLGLVADYDLDVYAETIALIDAVTRYGRNLADPESHPVVTSRYDMHALRRTPPTDTTPYADGPPVLRILYAYCRRSDGTNVAVILIGGDKTELGNQWYPPKIAEAERRLLEYCGRHQLEPLPRPRPTGL